MRGKLLAYLILATLSVLAISSCFGKRGKEELLPISKKALNDTSSIYYGAFSKYPKERSLLPIGVFDSGTGGLAVIETMMRSDSYDNITGKDNGDGIADFAGENFIYLADAANMPYGEYPEHGKTDYLRELSVRDVLFLMGNSYYNLAIDEKPTGTKEPVKIVVVACNSSSAYALNDIQRLLSLSGTGVRVVGIINAGVRAALENLDSTAKNSIAVMAASVTISSGAYSKAINEIAAQKGFSSTVNILNHSTLGLAEAVDGINNYIDRDATGIRGNYLGPKIGIRDGEIDTTMMDRYNFDFSNNSILYSMSEGRFTDIQLNSAANYARLHLVNLIEKHRRSGNQVPLNCIIMGSTHLSLLSDTLSQVITELKNYKRDGIYLYRNTIGKDFKFINPALYVARECYAILRESHQLAFRPEGGNLSPFISVPAYGLPTTALDTDGSLNNAYKYSRNPGTELETTKIVPFSPRYLDEGATKKIEILLPSTYELIKEKLY